jgi:Leucine-rich repeat (LRR) protein
LSDTDCSVFQFLPNLTGLTIIGSRKLTAIHPANPNTPTNVENTEIPGTPTITHLNWITGLKNLQTLVLVGCKNLSDISALKDLPNLKELDIRETAVKNTDFLTNSNLKIIK